MTFSINNDIRLIQINRAINIVNNVLKVINFVNSVIRVPSMINNVINNNLCKQYNKNYTFVRILIDIIHRVSKQ